MALHHLPARRAALGGRVRRLVASLPAVPTHEHSIVFGRNDPVARCRDAGSIGEIAGDEAEGSPALMPPTSGAGAGVGDR
jgi:hypothetical protein